MKDKAVIGIIGCGMIARDVHLGNAFSNPRFHVKWCCDVVPANLEYVLQHYAPQQTCADYREILGDSEVDGVLVLTTHNVRLEIIRAAAEAGKHIYVEKPMSTTMEESYEIMRVVRRCNVRLVVGFNRRCAPAIEDALGVYAAHKANPVDAPWRYQRLPGQHTHLPEEEATMLLMRVNDDLLSFKPYALDERIGQGSLIGELCHFVDLACYLMKKEPIRVSAEGWSRINQVLTIQFEDLSVATIFETAVGSFDHPKELIELYYKGASIVVDHYLQLRVGGVVDIYKKDYPFLADPYPEITEGEGSNLYINKVRERNRRVQNHDDFGFPTVDKGHYTLLDRFADCILQGAASPCDELDGARATLVTLKARQAIRTGMPVKISRDEYDFFFA